MKRQSLIILVCAIALIICSTWISVVRAAVRNPAGTLASGTSLVDIPLNTICTVTVDSRSTEKPVLAGTGYKTTGFVAPDVAEGVLIRLDSEWVVLRDGSYESWIPTHKVIMIHASR
jgi:hypothetical protein